MYLLRSRGAGGEDAERTRSDELCAVRSMENTSQSFRRYFIALLSARGRGMSRGGMKYPDRCGFHERRENAGRDATWREKSGGIRPPSPPAIATDDEIRHLGATPWRSALALQGFAPA